MEDYTYEEFVETEKDVETFKDGHTSTHSTISYKNVTQNWSSLKERFNLLFENWEKDKSVERYEALRVALTYLENCDIKSREKPNNFATRLYNTGDSEDSKSSGIVVIEIPKSQPPVQNKRFQTGMALNEFQYELQSNINIQSSETDSRNDNSLESLLNFNHEPTDLSNQDMFQCDPLKDKTLLDHKYVKKIGVR